MSRLQLPPFIHNLVNEAIERLRPRRVLLFGSRARGDAEPRADWDLAVEAPDTPDPEWLRFSLDAQERLDTLLHIDLVRLEEAGEELQAVIEKEGIPLYEREAQAQPAKL